jgi:hypothetical protein
MKGGGPPQRLAGRLKVCCRVNLSILLTGENERQTERKEKERIRKERGRDIRRKYTAHRDKLL